jgi:DNA-binding NtrC family response regulator
VYSNALTCERLLVAEDDPIIAADLEEALEDEGATIFPAWDVIQALRLIQTRALSAAVIETKLYTDNAEPVCEALSEHQVPFIFYSGWPDRPSNRWSAVPFVSKPAQVPVIIGALKYALSASKLDILSRSPEHGRNPNLVAIGRSILAGEERITRIERVIARLKAGGFDTSAAEALHDTMIASLNVMRDHLRLLTSEKWRP